MYPEQLDVRLDAPLGDRIVTDASTGNVVMDEPAVHLDPASIVPRLPADCTDNSVREAVEREVDGGLQHQLLACGRRWMAVFTYQNACPAIGDPVVDRRCYVHQQVGYFRAIEDIWRVIGFDDCDVVRCQYDDLPERICEAGQRAPVLGTSNT